MNDNIHSIYKNEEIDFLSEKGWKFFLLTKKSSRPYQSDQKTLYIQKSIEDVQIKQETSSFGASYLPNPTVQELTDKSEIAQHIRYGHDKADLAEEYFYIFYNKYPKYRKEILKESYCYFNIKIGKNLPTFLAKTSKNYDEAANNLLGFPISVLTTTTLDFNILDKKLKSLGGTEEQLLSFWLSFFKARKNQIQNPKISPIVSDFLSSRFEHEQLEHFFPFFTYLEAKHKDVEPDIFDSEYKFTTSTFINLKKMAKVFALDDWSYDNFETALNLFSIGIRTHFKLEESLFSDMNRSKKIFNIGFFHNNENFDQELLKSRIVQLFKSFKVNKTTTKDLTPNFFKSWLLQQDLQDKLSQKTDSKTKKMKL